ncbi:TagK domain-containing protein [Burkholderia stagnalis]|uniref:TagK domain-containing protein n=2 Tax=Burkholderia stagnalis TaxID=1503054 RepID=A0ABX9YMK4_9BURK|nr:TagK domain-containing protein [Burkholderia stagnalis]RQQ68035.1 TagK domain-containing protein [Burkholderia stagnalis]RQQ69311.1 TagK domain-containing protein [Burkholderia stagnalis]RQQ80214.1 TagK domain-containing protein [Burkholderia stagnalis]RQQ89281.1 TagK domain-containing protein [Burkholderia stagnalis]
MLNARSEMNSPEYDPVASSASSDETAQLLQEALGCQIRGVATPRVASRADLLGLIPCAAESTTDVTRAPSGASDEIGPDRELFESLRRQYRQALGDPHAMPAAPSWVPGPRTNDLARADVAATSNTDWTAPWSNDTCVLGDLFGSCTAPIPDAFDQADAVPEILGLFAPTDRVAGFADDRSASLPALSRKDHHLLGLDSPMPMAEALTGQPCDGAR